MARAKQPVSINGVEFDALIEETRTLEAEAPSYPIETGFEIQDSIILKPQTISMTLFITNTPVTWKDKGSPSHVQDIVKQLEDLYFSKTPVTIKTSEATYENYAILSIELTKTKETGSSREIPITFQEIRTTETKTATMPDSYGKSGATGAAAGTAGTTQSGTPPQSSAAGGNAGAGNGNTGSSTGSSENDGNAAGQGSILYNLANSAGLFGGGGRAGGLLGGLLGD
ncbi:MAG: hypothetical protein LBS84_03270 [Clostridiales bacterium]|jgi:hypothetical protein|nr:hypothetical protein [Clostridiales bacterium]